mgnify:FL=1|jgi:hypothetical protein
MAYSRITLDKNEKNFLSIAFILILIDQLNRYVPAIKDFWDGIDERIANVVGDLSIAGLGYIILSVAGKLFRFKGFMIFGVAGMIVGYTLIAVGLASVLGINLTDRIRSLFGG